MEKGFFLFHFLYLKPFSFPNKQICPEKNFSTRESEPQIFRYVKLKAHKPQAACVPKFKRQILLKKQRGENLRRLKSRFFFDGTGAKKKLSKKKAP